MRSGCISFTLLPPPDQVRLVLNRGLIAAQLGQPTTSRATIYLYPDAPSLRADTSLRLPQNVTTWVGADTIKLVYTSNITRTEGLQTALTQLVLAEAGLNEADAPWLWHGLPLALPYGDDVVAAQREFLLRP